MNNSPAFDDLVAAYSGEIFAYVWRLTRDSHDAEDCLQEAFLRAYRAFERLDGTANRRAWLYRIATNTTLTFLKRRSRENHRTAELDPALIGDETGPAEVVARRETLVELARAVNRLPPRQQAALVMRNYQELSYAEIAQVLGCTEAAARANVYQALKKLRREMVS